MRIKFKKTDQAAILPQYATEGASGMDLSACISDTVCLESGEAALIETGLAIELPEGFEAQIRPRSGLAAKHAITVLNSPGTIDADYRGPIKVVLINHSKVPFLVQPGMRIAQLVVSAAVVHGRPEFVDEINETERGDGGFGSTGTASLDGVVVINDPIKRGINLTNNTTLSAVSNIHAGQEAQGKSEQEYTAPQFRKGALSKEEIMNTLLNAGK